MRTYVIIILLVFHTTFSIAETKTAIKPSELNPKITNDIHTNYSGYIIIEAFKINNKGVFSFEAIIQKGKNKLNLFYDANGVFIRKVLPSQIKPAQKKVSSNRKKPNNGLY
jgi:hypothetical protein